MCVLLLRPTSVTSITAFVNHNLNLSDLIFASRSYIDVIL